VLVCRVRRRVLEAAFTDDEREDVVQVQLDIPNISCLYFLNLVEHPMICTSHEVVHTGSTTI
jgi:hypothetical protein